MPASRRLSIAFVLLAVCAAPPAAGQEASQVGRRLPPADAAGRAKEPSPADAADDDDGGGRAVRLPPVPDGTPAEILAYVEKISDPKAMPRSRGRKRYYLKKVAAAYSEAADRIIAAVKTTDPLFLEAVQLKLDGFSMLKSLGEEKAAAAGRLAFAKTLVDSPHPAVARLAQRQVLAADVDALYASGSAEGADRLITALAALLATTGADAPTAQIAAQLATDLDVLPDATAAARLAWETFIPLFAKSEDPRVRVHAEEGQAVLRRLTLPGKPLAIEGKRLDGDAFDPGPLAGKVVVVDFWATWCKPCVAEIPNLRALRDKYGRHGLEVVAISLDDEREDLDAFLEKNEIPWTVLHAGLGVRDPFAIRYGIRSIPRVFVVGRDGTVLSVDARGEKLEALLAEQFPDAK